MLAFSFKCARLREISLVLLCSYFLYINDKSVMTWLRQKGWNTLTFGFSLSSIAQPVTVVEALCVLSGKRAMLYNKYFGYWFIPDHISSAPQAFCFLKCSLLARKICQMLVLAKINTLLACLQMLAKTIPYPLSSLLYGTLFLIVKCTAGVLHFKMFFIHLWNFGKKFNLFSFFW